MQTKLLTTLALALLVTTGAINRTEMEDNEGSFQLPGEYILDGEPPVYDAGVFKLRRQRLMKQMEGSIAVISAATGNDFIYLTGFTEDRQAIAILDASSDKPYTLFVLPREPMATLWDGERPGIKGAVEIFGADAAYQTSEFSERLAEVLSGNKSVSMHADDRMLRERINPKGSSRPVFTDLAPILHEMRVIKDDWEIARLKRAIEVTALAQKRVLKTVAPGQKEYDVQAEIEYVFRKNGLPTGFSTITGSGPNAAILHYTRNDRTLQDGDLILMDIGAASDGYVADITRTIPVNGVFSDNQKELYSLVLKANQEAIKKMVPGMKMLDCHHRATEIITRGLYDIGLITDTTSWWQKRFYIHYRNNHYIGLHVHDVGSYGDLNAADRDAYIVNPEIRGRDLLPGMVLTIEPGIYLIADRLEHLHGLFGHMATKEELDAFAEKVRPVYEKYAGIGIRIEDDVLITAEGNIVLSERAPKTVEDIESAMRK
ncbi:MAG: aminopeptidase P N-terminal domain-containing protein [Bacteroidales bacterium]